MVCTSSQLATIFLLAFGATSVVAAPLPPLNVILNPGSLVTSNGKPVYKHDPVVPSKRAEAGVNTRSSKYAIDYHPTWAMPAPTEAAATVPVAEKTAPSPNTRSSKYAIDYLPSWAVNAEEPAVTNVAEKVQPPAPATTKSSKYAIDYLPSWAVQAPEPKETETLKVTEGEKPAPATRSSKYAIDYIPTWAAPAPKETGAEKTADDSTPVPTPEAL